MRRLAALLCLGALLVCACGGDDAGDARKAAQDYVTTLGQRNGAGTCALMTKGLQRQFTDWVRLGR